MSLLRTVLVYAGSILLFLFLIPGGVILGGRWLDRLWGWPLLPWRILPGVIGTLLILAGLSFIRSAWLALLRLGKGHPQEAFGYPLLPPTRRVVIDGPYNYTRNPMLLGFLLHLLGAVLIFRSPSALLFCYPILCVLAVLYLKKVEEPRLIARFGQEYQEYRDRTSFLIPSVPD